MLQGVGGEVRQPGALAAHQGHMAGMAPAPKSIDGIGDAGGGLGQIGRIDLGHIAQAGDLGAGAGARDQRLHLLGREVLRLIQDDEPVEEGMVSSAKDVIF